MQIEVEHPDFQTQRLSVEIPLLFGGPRLFVNGLVAEKDKETYVVHSDSGAETSIVLRRNFFDPVPKMKISNEPIKLARSFNALEYIWFVFLVLSFANTPIPGGGLIGAIGAIASARVFRGKSGAITKFGLLALIVFGALIAAVLIGLQLPHKAH